jgi:hypothetical protein
MSSAPAPHPGGAGAGTSAGLEIACDESGSEGEKLVGGTTDAFAHASLHPPHDVAADCMDEVRRACRSPATECKASVVLRSQNHRVLTWLLGPEGPLHGHGHVHLTEKTFHLVAKIVALLGLDPGVAPTLYREGPQAFGPTGWPQLLTSFNDLMRAHVLEDGWAAANDFFDHAELVGGRRSGTGIGDALAEVAERRPRTAGDLAPLLDRSRAGSVLDPQVPGLVGAVVHWGAGGDPVSVVHDVQATLTPDRMRHVEAECRRLDPRVRLAGIRFVDSMTDPRVQVADLLAGAVRRIAAEALHGRGDPALAALVAPYVDRASIWGDPASWAHLTGSQPASGPDHSSRVTASLSPTAVKPSRS